jgi:hypothetical protein
MTKGPDVSIVDDDPVSDSTGIGSGSGPGGGYDAGSDDPGSPEDFGGISDDYGGGDYKGAFVGEQYKTNKGLAGKNKKKPKKMKRGGLASR